MFQEKESSMESLWKLWSDEELAVRVKEAMYLHGYHHIRNLG